MKKKHDKMQKIENVKVDWKSGIMGMFLGVGQPAQGPVAPSDW